MAGAGDQRPGTAVVADRVGDQLPVGLEPGAGFPPAEGPTVGDQPAVGAVRGSDHRVDVAADRGVAVADVVRGGGASGPSAAEGAVAWPVSGSSRAEDGSAHGASGPWGDRSAGDDPDADQWPGWRALV